MKGVCSSRWWEKASYLRFELFKGLLSLYFVILKIFFFLLKDDFVHEYICRTVHFIILVGRMNHRNGFNYLKVFLLCIFFFISFL